MSGLLTLESGVSVTVLQTSETRIQGDLRGYLFYGEEGIVQGTEEGHRVYERGGEPGPLITYPEAEQTPFEEEIQAFAQAVAGGNIGPTDAYGERRSLAVVQAGYESARSGQPVVLRERFGDL